MSNGARIVKRFRQRSFERGVKSVKRLGFNMKMAAHAYANVEKPAYDRGYDAGYAQATKDAEEALAEINKEKTNEAT